VGTYDLTESAGRSGLTVGQRRVADRRLRQGRRRDRQPRDGRRLGRSDRRVQRGRPRRA